MNHELAAGQNVVITLRCEAPDHRYEYRSFPGVVVSVGKKTAKVDTGGHVYQRPFEGTDMEAYRIKFTRPNGEITIRDLAFSQTVETTGALTKDQKDAFWNNVEVELPPSNDRPWNSCRALLIKEV